MPCSVQGGLLSCVCYLNNHIAIGVTKQMFIKCRELQRSKYDAEKVGSRCLWGTQLHRVLYVEEPLQREGERERKREERGREDWVPKSLACPHSTRWTWRVQRCPRPCGAPRPASLKRESSCWRTVWTCSCGLEWGAHQSWSRDYLMCRRSHTSTQTWQVSFSVCDKVQI